jgi:hypothetical protein
LGLAENELLRYVASTMKLRLVLALLSLAIACGAIAIKASSQAKASATAAPVAIGNETCSDCDAPDPTAALPNPYKPGATTAAAAVAQTTPAAPAKN